MNSDTLLSVAGELPLVITLNVSPAGLHSVLITASNASYSALNTVQYSLLGHSGDISSGYSSLWAQCSPEWASAS